MTAQVVQGGVVRDATDPCAEGGSQRVEVREVFKGTDEYILRQLFHIPHVRNELCHDQLHLPPVPVHQVAVALCLALSGNEYHFLFQFSHESVFLPLYTHQRQKYVGKKQEKCHCRKKYITSATARLAIHKDVVTSCEVAGHSDDGEEDVNDGSLVHFLLCLFNITHKCAVSLRWS